MNGVDKIQCWTSPEWSWAHLETLYVDWGLDRELGQKSEEKKKGDR